MNTKMKTVTSKANHLLKQRYMRAAAVLLTAVLCTVPAMAADDPLAIINSLSDFIFNIIKAIGAI